jgi:hypothetical protein
VLAGLSAANTKKSFFMSSALLQWKTYLIAKEIKSRNTQNEPLLLIKTGPINFYATTGECQLKSWKEMQGKISSELGVQSSEWRD